MTTFPDRHGTTTTREESHKIISQTIPSCLNREWGKQVGVRGGFDGYGSDRDDLTLLSR